MTYGGATDPRDLLPFRGTGPRRGWPSPTRGRRTGAGDACLDLISVCRNESARVSVQRLSLLRHRGVGDALLDPPRTPRTIAGRRTPETPHAPWASLRERAIRDQAGARWRFLEHRQDPPLLPPGTVMDAGRGRNRRLPAADLGGGVTRVIQDGPAPRGSIEPTSGGPSRHRLRTVHTPLRQRRRESFSTPPTCPITTSHTASPTPDIAPCATLMERRSPPNAWARMLTPAWPVASTPSDTRGVAGRPKVQTLARPTTSRGVPLRRSSSDFSRSGAAPFTRQAPQPAQGGVLHGDGFLPRRELGSDCPRCHPPLLASVARLVNDLHSYHNRRRLAELIPSVIGLTTKDPRLTSASPCGARRRRFRLPLPSANAPPCPVLAADVDSGRAGGPPARSPQRHQRAAMDSAPSRCPLVRTFARGVDVSVERFRRFGAPNTVVASPCRGSPRRVSNPDECFTRCSRRDRKTALQCAVRRRPETGQRGGVTPTDRGGLDDDVCQVRRYDVLGPEAGCEEVSYWSRVRCRPPVTTS